MDKFKIGHQHTNEIVPEYTDQYYNYPEGEEWYKGPRRSAFISNDELAKYLEELNDMWNYRIVREDTKPEPTLSIRMVYFIRDKPIYWSHDAVQIKFGEGEDKREICDKLINAFRQPIINAEDLTNDGMPF